MGKWEYLVSMETASKPNAANEVLGKWRAGHLPGFVSLGNGMMKTTMDGS